VFWWRWRWERCVFSARTYKHKARTKSEKTEI